MEQPRLADAARLTRHVFIRDLVLSASIGVFRHEHHTPQRLRINLDLAVADDGVWGNVSRAAAADPTAQEDLSRVVNYAAIADRVRQIVAAGHVKLVETLAERLAEACLEDARVRTARIRIEKLDVFADAASAGVEIERRR